MHHIPLSWITIGLLCLPAGYFCYEHSDYKHRRDFEKMKSEFAAREAAIQAEYERKTGSPAVFKQAVLDLLDRTVKCPATVKLVKFETKKRPIGNWNEPAWPGSWKATGSFDSQNGFGAIVRTDFVVWADFDLMDFDPRSPTYLDELPVEQRKFTIKKTDFSTR